MDTPKDVREMSVAELVDEYAVTVIEFDKIYFHKKSMEMLMERALPRKGNTSPEKKYPEFHRHLDIVHELWFKDHKTLCVLLNEDLAREASKHKK